MLAVPFYKLFLAVALPFFLSMLFTFFHFRIMKSINWGQYIRKYGPKIHEYKTGTPTAGGAAIILSLIAGFFFLWFFFPDTGRYFPILLTGTVSFGAIGFLDDLLSIIKQRSKGLSIRSKILFQILASGGVFYLLLNFDKAREINVPFMSHDIYLKAFFLWGLTTITLIAAANAVNLTDGLDGLATGTSIITVVALSFIASGELIPFSVVFVGALLGFMWYNFYPAHLFMGDTGSFALGGFIGTAFLIEGLELYLPFLGAIFVFEALSVMIQVAIYKNTGTRLFKVSPLHHHFEHAEGIDYDFILPEIEWEEPLITIRFFIVQALFSIFGLTVFYYF